MSELTNVVFDKKSGVHRCKKCGRSVSVKPGNNYCPKCGTCFLVKRKTGD